MAIFRKRRRAEAEAERRIDPDERSPQLGLKYKDLIVLSTLQQHGADLTQEREVLHHCYAPSRAAAEALGADLEPLGFSVRIDEPTPEDPGEWGVVARTEAILGPDVVRDTGNAFDELAAKHGATYDGWEAALEPRLPEVELEPEGQTE